MKFLLIFLFYLSFSAADLEVKEKVNCCSAVLVESTGPAVENQWTRLGKFLLTGEKNGRAEYTQDNGQNYIYFLGAYDEYPGYDWWYISDVLGYNSGGMINYDKQVNCPDQISTVWDVYVWKDEWAEINDWYPDETLKVTCTDGPAPPETTTSSNTDHESCTWGSWCDNCSVYTMYNGIKYCCGTNCNSGGIHVSAGDNNMADCYCYH